MVHWIADITLKTANGCDLLHIDSETGRQFRARRIGNRFFLEEIVAVGVWSQMLTRWEVGPSHEWLTCTPNEVVLCMYQAVARRFPQKIDFCDLVAIGSGVLPDAELFTSLDECTQRVRHCIAQNVFYLPGHVNPSRVRQKNLVWVRHFMSLQTRLDRAQIRLFSLRRFDIDTDLPAPVMAYLAHPSSARWNAIAALPVYPSSKCSLWDAWRRIDARAPATKPWLLGRWKKIPSSEVLRRAIQQVILEDQVKYTRQVQSLRQQIHRIQNVYSIRVTALRLLTECHPRHPRSMRFGLPHH